MNSGVHEPTLGVVAICFNEETDMPGFLSQLTGWIDEIILVDDGSTDATPAIVSACSDAVTFIVSPRGRDEYFSHQRNKGIAAARSDWLLHLDIDERVTPELAREILTAIRDPDKDAYRFRRLNHFLHRPMLAGGWADWNLVHLARREVFHFEGMFHERCVVASPQDRVGQLSQPMYHLNEPDYRKRIQKSDAYLDEMIVTIRETGKPVQYPSLLLRPAREFLKRYILKLGFTDGVPGLISALHSASAVFRANAVVWDEQNHICRKQLESSFSEKWDNAEKFLENQR